MTRDLNIEKFVTKSGNVTIEKNTSKLAEWYELEEKAHEAYKQSGGKGGDLDDDVEQWKKLTGIGRRYSCLIGEVEGTIKYLGGKLYQERTKDTPPPPPPNNFYVCKTCREAFNSVEDWEVNKKKRLVEDCSKGIHHITNMRVVRKAIHNKCWKFTLINRDNDISPCGCSNVTIQEQLEFTPQNALKSYFITNKVKKISKRLEELKIEYLDGRSKNIGSESEDNAYEVIMDFMKEHNKTDLNRSDLSITDQNTPTNPPKTPQKNKPNPQIAQYIFILQQIQTFFIANNIHSITNQSGNLVITFNTNTNTNTNN